MGRPLPDDALPAGALARAETLRLEVEPGLVVAYQRLGARGRDAPTLVLANGLGGRLYAWEPLLEHYAPTHRILTWDYRGLFESGTPARSKALAIPHHAQDALRILDREGVRSATFVGWSMGVQVSLEAALEAPERVERLVLLNGTYGQVFQTGVQPLFRMPLVPYLLHALVERLSRRDSRLVAGIQGAARSELHLSLVATLLSRLWADEKIGALYRRYVDDVFGPTFPNYLRLFQELDAHSVYHHLPDVTQPALVVSGTLDWLTPARLAFHVARRIPRAEHLHLGLGSHFALLEQPQRVLARMDAFLAA